MKRIISLALAVLLAICLFVGCNSDPSDKEVYSLVQKAIDTILLYTNNTPAEIIKQEFPEIEVVYDGENLPAGLGYITDLDYSDFLDKYGQIFDDATLKEFIFFLGTEYDGALALTGWELEKHAEVSDISLELISKNENEFTYELIFVETKAYDGSICDMY